jgi:hypothetical protein
MAAMVLDTSQMHLITSAHWSVVTLEVSNIYKSGVPDAKISPKGMGKLNGSS